jgi:hypothetical protein
MGFLSAIIWIIVIYFLYVYTIERMERSQVVPQSVVQKYKHTILLTLLFVKELLF